MADRQVGVSAGGNRGHEHGSAAAAAGSSDGGGEVSSAHRGTHGTAAGRTEAGGRLAGGAAAADAGEGISVAMSPTGASTTGLLEGRSDDAEGPDADDAQADPQDIDAASPDVPGTGAGTKAATAIALAGAAEEGAAGDGAANGANESAGITDAAAGKGGSPHGGNVPHMSYLEVFWLFLTFGLRAWGGPMAQIALIKQTLVIEQKWIPVEKFNRVLAVYQVLPGPEATELCCYFGLLARGRIGAVLGGLGFVLPGFLLTLLCSYLYTQFGLSSQYVRASFYGLQMVVVGMCFRAVHRIGEHAVQDHTTHTVDSGLFFLVLFSALTSVMRINFFIALAYSGVLACFFRRKWYIPSALLLAAGLVAYILVAVYLGLPSTPSSGSGITSDRTDGGMFLLGLLAGCLTFGGAYTAIPFVQQDAVVSGGWITNQQFLDGLAISSVLPAPLVIFVTFVGFIGKSIEGSILMTLGMFLPAFSFTIIGHELFEKVISYQAVSTFLDGVSASVVGLIAITACQLARAAIFDPLGAIMVLASIIILFTVKNKWASMLLVFAGAIVGQVFWAPSLNA